MAKHNSGFPSDAAQGAMFDDPGFPREIVGRTVQQVPGAEMTAHIGTSKYERGERRVGRGRSRRSCPPGIRGTRRLWC
jgi:transposase-like protein